VPRRCQQSNFQCSFILEFLLLVVGGDPAVSSSVGGNETGGGSTMLLRWWCDDAVDSAVHHNSHTLLCAALYSRLSSSRLPPPPFRLLNFLRAALTGRMTGGRCSCTVCCCSQACGSFVSSLPHLMSLKLRGGCAETKDDREATEDLEE
jgi:hypothetical protein